MYLSVTMPNFMKEKEMKKNSIGFIFLIILSVGLLVMFFGMGMLTAMALPLEPMSSGMFYYVLPLWCLACALFVFAAMGVIIFREVNKDVDTELKKRAEKEEKRMNVNVDIAFQNTIRLNERLLEIAKENGVDTKEIEENIAKAKAMYADFLKGVEE